ncbi:hypothetical protein CMV_022792, partial [Castanea mollissima]
MAAPFIAGFAVAAAAYAGRYGIIAWQAFKARPPRPKFRKFYDGGFQSTMTRREAALILGVREGTPLDKVKEAHRRVMVANHPDAGGNSEKVLLLHGKCYFAIQLGCPWPGIDTFTYIYNGNGWLTIPVAPNHLLIDSVAFFTLTFSSTMAAKLSVQGSDMLNFHYFTTTNTQYRYLIGCKKPSGTCWQKYGLPYLCRMMQASNENKIYQDGTDCIARISPKDGTLLGWVLLHNLRENLVRAGNN